VTISITLLSDANIAQKLPYQILFPYECSFCGMGRGTRVRITPLVIYQDAEHGMDSPPCHISG